MAIDAQKSAKNRQDMKTLLGFVPQSVISQITRGALSRRMYHYSHENPHKNSSVVTKDKVKRIRKGGVNITAVPAGRGETLSIFPPELVDFFIRYYLDDWRGKVYLDPFSGQGIRMQVACMRGMKYYGMDISKAFFAFNDLVRKKIDPDGALVHIKRGDSRDPSWIEDEIGDFSLHSPPYWNIENYGDEPEQLGKQPYLDFIGDMEKVLAAWLPKFKTGAYHVINVGDFRIDGKFYAYHADLINAGIRAGWHCHDIWILKDVVASASRVFAVSRNLKKVAPRVHEYALIFRKP